MQVAYEMSYLLAAALDSQGSEWQRFAAPCCLFLAFEIRTSAYAVSAGFVLLLQCSVRPRTSYIYTFERSDADIEVTYTYNQICIASLT